MSLRAIVAVIVVIAILAQLGITEDHVFLTLRVILHGFVGLAFLGVASLLFVNFYLEPRERAKKEEQRIAERDSALRPNETIEERLLHRLRKNFPRELREIANKRFFNIPTTGPNWQAMLELAVRQSLRDHVSVDEYVLALQLLEEVKDGKENELTFPLFAERQTIKASHQRQLEMSRGDHIRQRLTDGTVITGQQFEDWCKSALAHQGWTIEETAGSGDQGVDLIGYFRGVKFVFQCKHYSNTVGNTAVQEVIAGKIFYGASVGVVVTSGSGYSPSAVRLADAADVVLISGNEIFSIDSKVNWG